jgi:hypothetical protein
MLRLTYRKSFNSRYHLLQIERFNEWWAGIRDVFVAEGDIVKVYPDATADGDDDLDQLLRPRKPMGSPDRSSQTSSECCRLSWPLPDRQTGSRLLRQRGYGNVR